MCKSTNKNKAYIETSKYKNIGYVIQKPEDFNPDDKYPMVILLHGAGWRGNDVSLLKDYPIFEAGIQLKDMVYLKKEI